MNMLNTVRIIIALAYTLLASSAHALLPGGISGFWFSPERPGNGLSVMKVRPGEVIVVWHSNDLEGNPLTLYVEGAIDGRSIVGTIYAPRGTRFGASDRDDFEFPVWGELFLKFDSCVEGTLRWEAQAAGFPDGQVPISRLGFIDGTPCALHPLTEHVGLFSGRDITDNLNFITAIGMLDPDGRLWAIENSIVIPSPAWVGSRLPQAFITNPVEADATQDVIQIDGRAGSIWWTAGQYTPTLKGGAYPGAQLNGEWEVSGDELVGHTNWTQERANPVLTKTFFHRWLPGAPDGIELVEPVSLSMLAGDYMVPMADQSPDLRFADMTIDETGKVCIGLGSPWFAEDECQLVGTVTAQEGHIGLIDFELRSTLAPTRQPFVGRGWVMMNNGERELALVGHDGSFAFGLLAWPNDTD